ncbi:rhomboid-domain-containing protein [Rhizoclosmatium globosum]|uniref:Rhomboid-domain-containing protein n=1 Tax=Rhizoclosmatium globosum TaxID=329046 RepID=A0A1Y2D0X5_9FUNG|nr:rhomboid-domain-containing protein [Rhizoclosmatium globosum]|eukprot:ORY52857.1 rhomboid-domain-containing protein [Rhizoclosmatium globosum]
MFTRSLLQATRSIHIIEHSAIRPSLLPRINAVWRPQPISRPFTNLTPQTHQTRLFSTRFTSAVRAQIEKFTSREHRQYATLSGRYRGGGSGGRGYQPELDPDVVLYSIIGINTIVFLLWQYAIIEKRNGNGAWLNFMQDNFYSNWHSLEAGRWWTSITCAFSHNTILHFGLNMFVLHGFGNVAMGIIGPSRFLVFYLAAGAVSSTAHLVYTRFIEPSLKGNQSLSWYPGGFRDSSSHGASGAISASLLLYALTYPMNPINLFFFIQVPAFVGIGGYLAYDLYLATSGKSGVVDNAAHIGGAVFGVGYWLAFVRGMATRGRF